MIASIVPNSAFAEAGSDLAASSQAVTEMVEGTEEVTQQEETTGEEPAEQPAGETASDEESVAEPSTEPAAESEQPTAEPSQTPAETAVPSEQPSAEPSAAPEGTEAPEGTAVPSETPAASATPAPSESPVPSETPAATEEPVVLEEQTVEAVIYDSAESAQMEIMLMDLAQQEQQAKITLTGEMPKNAVVKAYPVNVEIESEKILAAYDITIYDEQGNVFQPENDAVTVKIETPEIQEALAETTELNVYHMEDEQAAPEVVEEVVPEETAVSFEAESFSIYVVGTHYTHTYIFKVDNKEYDTQILSAGEVLNQPKTPDVQDGQFFKGWYTDAGELFKDFGQEEDPLADNVTTTLHAKFEDAYYVFYKANGEADSRIIYTQKYNDGATVVSDNVPFVVDDVDKALIGWSEQPNATEPQETIVISGQDIVLYPVVVSAHWVNFDSMGGSWVDPIFVKINEQTKAPTDPEWAGYRFDGWYTDKEYNQKFEFGTTLSESVTLYAKWTPTTVDYTVLYWTENADDDGYSFYDSKTQSGTTGSWTNVAAGRAPDGFEVISENPVEQKVIQGDGSTVVHVYYDRKTYSVRFYTSTRRGEEIEGLRITAKYGETISHLWPSKRENVPGVENRYLVSKWIVTEGGLFEPTVYQSGIDTMPLNGAKFYYDSASGKYTYNSNYYLENINNNDYTLDHTDVFKSSDTGWKTSPEDYYPIKGFSVNKQLSPREGAYAKWDSSNGVYKWDFYYDRNEYNIVFKNQGEADRTQTFKYQADISKAGYTPTAPAGKEDYKFAGWYTNEYLLGDPYDFNGKTMPAGDFVLYAKWVAPTYTVSFDLNGAPEQEGFESITVEQNQTINRPSNPMWENHKFAGWVKEDGTPFNFSTQIVRNTKLTAQWVSEKEYQITYESGNGKGEAVTDPVKYADKSEAKILDVPEGWTAPDEHTGFVYWSTEANGSGTKYYPGDTFVMPDHDVTLYAQWAPVRETTLTYDYNYGTGFDEKKKTVTISNPNEEYEVMQEATPPTGENWIFLGWYTEPVAEEGAELIGVGDKIQVDTIDAGSKNILYAQWQKTGTLTIEKTVEGLSDAALEELKNEISFTVRGGKLDNSPIVIDSKSKGWANAWEGSTFTYNVTLPVTDVTGMQKYTVTESGYEGVTNYDWVAAGSVTEQANIEVTETSSGEAKLTNVYKASIGDLTITKKLESWNNFKGDEVTFIFKAVNQKDTSKVYYTTMTFTKNNYTVEQTKVLEDIPAGAYDVTELHTTGYVPTNEQYTVPASTDGIVASFVNEANGDKNPGDNGHANNQFTYKDGKWTWNRTYGES